MAELRDILDTDVVARLLDKDLMGRTMLHVAAAAGQREVVKMLARRSAGVTFDDETSSEEEDDEDPYRSWRERTASERAQSPLRGTTPLHRSGSGLGSTLPAEARVRETKDDKVQMLHVLDEEEPARCPPAGWEAGEEQGRAQVSPVRFVDFDPQRSALDLDPQRSASEQGKGNGDGELRWGYLTPGSAGGRKTPGTRGSRRASTGRLSTAGAPSERVKTGMETWDTMLNTRDRAGDTPLHLAAGEGHADVCRSLIRRGAEVEMRNLAGRTPLHVAAMNGAAPFRLSSKHPNWPLFLSRSYPSTGPAPVPRSPRSFRPRWPSLLSPVHGLGAPCEGVRC